MRLLRVLKIAASSFFLAVQNAEAATGFGWGKGTPMLRHCAQSSTMVVP